MLRFRREQGFQPKQAERMGMMIHQDLLVCSVLIRLSPKRLARPLQVALGSGPATTGRVDFSLVSRL